MPKPEIDQKYLLQFLIALELWKSGLTQEEIGRRLHLGNNTISAMLKGVNRPKPTN